MTGPSARAWGVTDREHDVLVLVAGHLTNAQIADRLVVSVRTVESHLSSLIRKLDVADRRSLARRADQLGLLRGRVRWPVPGSGFVGREAEGATLATALAERRMVTVTGPGGVGKTRLTVRTAEQVARERPDGGWFADLSLVADGRSVVTAVASAVGVVEPPGGSVTEALRSVLARADGVLVLDNCEHVLAEVDRFVDRVLTECPRVTIVATSRARLGASYEWVYELPGLGDDDAVSLFCDRAASAGGPSDVDPSRVADLCSRLEGMALAIELAAARYPSLGFDGLAAGLDDPLRLLGGRDDGPRQRSLRSTIAWSVALLDDPDREVFEVCSVFASWFTGLATHGVLAADRSAADAAQALARLADQHLLQVNVGEPTRYRFQEVVRQFAAKRLGSRAASAEARHAAWVASELESLGRGPRDAAWCDAFDALSTEARVAVDRTGAGSPLGERFAEELVQRGRLEEAQLCFERLAAGTTGGERVRLLRLAAGAAAARLVGDEAMRLLEETHAAAVLDGDLAAAADALAWQVIYANLAPGIMAHPPPADVTERALSEADRLAPAGSRAEATVAVAAATHLSEADPRAEPAARSAAARAEAAGRPIAASHALDQLCGAHLTRNEISDALRVLDERGRLLRDVPLDAASAYAFNDYLLMGCEVALAAGDLPRSVAYAEQLAALPCYRDYEHPALARRLEVDVLSGDLGGAVERGERFRASWERAGRHRASTLAVGTYSLALAHGLLDHQDERDEWRRATEHLLAARNGTTTDASTGWAPTLDAILLLDRGDVAAAQERLTVHPDDPLWRAWNTGLWLPWYAAVWAESAVLSAHPDASSRVTAAAHAARGNPVAAAVVHRAEALATGSLARVDDLAVTFDRLGCAYQRDRSRRLARDPASGAGRASTV